MIVFNDEKVFLVLFEKSGKVKGKGSIVMQPWKFEKKIQVFVEVLSILENELKHNEKFFKKLRLCLLLIYLYLYKI